jgi:hypothetical protein
MFATWTATAISALSVAFWATTGECGSAQILLTIDDSNPSAVTITATGNDPLVNASGNTANEGVDLLQFFTQNESGMTFGQRLLGALTGGNIGVNYNDVYSDNQSTGNLTYPDMELYVDFASAGQANTENFSTTQPAFSGTWTINLSALGVTSAALPAAGTEGSIISGYSANPGAIIGQWQVVAVPEPDAAHLAAGGFAAVGIWVFWQRRKSGRS